VTTSDAIPPFSRLKKYLKEDFSEFETNRLAILSWQSPQFIAQAIRGLGFEFKINFDIQSYCYSEIDAQIYSENSDLYQFDPDIVLLIPGSADTLDAFYGLDTAQRALFADQQLTQLENIWRLVLTHSRARVIQTNLCEFSDNAYGNLGGSIEHALIFQLRKLNYLLAGRIGATPGVYLNDVSLMQASIGRNQWLDVRFQTSFDMDFNTEFVSLFAHNTLKIVSALSGQFTKCIILDLDNTLWGGVIGDDGIEGIEIGGHGLGKAYQKFQKWLLELKKRGILLAVCSKNTESIAREAFEQHPEMILKLEDFAIFVANWENKADNIRYIQEVLNIGFNSMVFVDDNPVERAAVSLDIDGITVPNLPEDPFEYLGYLQGLNLFESASFSDEDTKRVEYYQTEAIRDGHKVQCRNHDEFLQSLEMESEYGPFTAINISRIAQLTQRSNQFNFRTVRYSDSDIRRIADADNYLTRYFRLRDKFGDSGIVGLVILEKRESTLFIDTWIMSCRVLKRGLEAFMLTEMLNLAQCHQKTALVGEYLPTQKNVLVKDLFAEFGFKYADNVWSIDAGNLPGTPCFIHPKPTSGA
jgi:FkbH-like protein